MTKVKGTVENRFRFYTNFYQESHTIKSAIITKAATTTKIRSNQIQLIQTQSCSEQKQQFVQHQPIQVKQM
jgi:hypothetical protein